MSAPSPATAPLRIAYLVNRYPAVSHSFIRREIAALEAAGHAIDRYSIRPADPALPDPRDRAERARTRVILAQPAAVVAALLRHAVLHPRRVWRGWRCAGRMTDGVRRLAYLAEAAWLAAAFRRHPPDHLHAHFGTNPAAVARLVGTLTGVRWSFTVHGADEVDAPVALDLAGKVADAAFTVAVSDFGRSQLLRWADPVHWPRVHVVRCGVAPSAEPPAVPIAGRLACVARLAPEKGLPLLIEAMALVRDRGIDCTLTVVGDGPLRAALLAATAVHGLDDRIVFTGSLDEAGVANAIRGAHALVVPSFMEGLPVVIMEAYRLGTPVVATRVAGIPELVDDASGWPVAPGSATALATALAAALAAPTAERAAKAACGAQRVAERHDSRTNAAKLALLFAGAPGG